MGWGIGNGIGWPNASAQSTALVMGWFLIVSRCDGEIETISTPYMDTNQYNSGDYVYCTSTDCRVLLGAIVTEDPGIPTRNIEGPAYTSCF